MCCVKQNIILSTLQSVMQSVCVCVWLHIQSLVDVVTVLVCCVPYECTLCVSVFLK